MLRFPTQPVLHSGAPGILLAGLCFITGGSAFLTNHHADEENVVAITASAGDFQAPDTIPSGWTTLRLQNLGAGEIHEISLARLPDESTFEEYRDDVIPVWEQVNRQIKSVELGPDELSEYLRSHLPGWYSEVQWVHSRGLLSYGRTADNTVYLEPGVYSLESWLKTKDGELYLSRGLLREMVVTDETSGDLPPTISDVRIQLTDSLVTMEDTLKQGRRRISVRLADGALGRPMNLHLIRIKPDTDPDEVARWMEWYDADGLRSPEPAQFLGGFATYGRDAEDDTIHFTVDVDAPGDYAWIVGAPVPNPFWHVFTVN